MIHALIRAAHRLDLWLQRRLGRPYNVLLGVGLTIEVIRRLTELPAHLAEAPRVAGALLAVAMDMALLIHQLGEMSHRMAARRAGRSALEGDDARE
jgi:hypothetical protein